MKNLSTTILAAIFLTASGAAISEEVVVSQKNKEFSVPAINVKTGDSISFLNEDSFHHNIFSLSDTMLFDLGSFDQGQARSVKFEEAGVVDVECAIHPNMKLTVTVE